MHVAQARARKTAKARLLQPTFCCLFALSSALSSTVGQVVPFATITGEAPADAPADGWIPHGRADGQEGDKS